MTTYCKAKPWANTPHSCNEKKGHDGRHDSSVLHGEYVEDKKGHLVAGRSRHRWLRITWRTNKLGKAIYVKHKDTEWIKA